MRKVSGSNSIIENSVWASLARSTFCASAHTDRRGTASWGTPPLSFPSLSFPSLSARECQLNIDVSAVQWMFTWTVLWRWPFFLVVGWQLRVLFSNRSAPTGCYRAQTGERALHHWGAWNTFWPGRFDIWYLKKETFMKTKTRRRRRVLVEERTGGEERV